MPEKRAPKPRSEPKAAKHPTATETTDTSLASESQNNGIIADLGEGIKVRLKIGQCTMRDVANYNVFRREGMEWEKALKLADPTGNTGEMVTELRLSWLARAQMLAALKQCDLSTDDGNTWTVSTMPEAWKTVDGFLDTVPASLYWEWHQMSLDHNPGLWDAFGATEKKGAPVIVRL